MWMRVWLAILVHHFYVCLLELISVGWLGWYTCCCECINRGYIMRREVNVVVVVVVVVV